MIPYSKSSPLSLTIVASGASTRCARPYFTERYIQPPIYHLQEEGGGGEEEEKKRIYSFKIIPRRDQGTSLKPVESNSDMVHAKRPRSISGDRPHDMRLRRQGKKERQRKRERQRDR